MPRDRANGSSSGSGRPALASFRDDDYEDFVSVVRYLPTLVEDEGLEIAIGFVQTELPSLVDLLGVARPDTPEDRAARAAIGIFYQRGPARLLCDATIAGFRFQTDFIHAVEHELYASGVRAVFERSAPTEEKPYAPNVPSA